MRILKLLFPKWETVSTKSIECELTSHLFKQEWTETRILEHQKDRLGRSRYFWVKENSKTRVEESFIRGHGL